jgi:hypothetical protein
MTSPALPTERSPGPRRRRTASLAAAGLGLLAGLWPLRGGAEEPAAPAEPPAAPAVSPAEAEQLPALNTRLQSILEQLRPYDIPHLDEIAAAPAATSLAELTARVDRLYVEAAFQAAHRFWTYENNLRALTDERVRLEAARVEQPKLEKELAAAPDRLKAEEVRVAELTARAASEERIATILHDNAAAMEETFVAARSSAINAVYSLLPAAQRVAFYNGTQKNSNHPAYAHLPEVESDRATRAAPVAPKPAAPRTAAAGPVPPQPVSGTIDDKFAAFADKQRALRNLAALLPPQEKPLAAARELAEAQVQRNEALAVHLAEFTAPLAKCTAIASEAEDRILTAQVNQKISAGNLLRLGTSALLWTYLREHIVAPQLERFLEDNRMTKGKKGLSLVDAINRQPRDFIPRSGTFDKPEALGSLRLKLLDVEPSMEVWASVATDALAAGKISTGADLTRRFFQNLDKPGVEILRASLDTLETPQRKIALALLARAPAE